MKFQIRSIYWDIFLRLLFSFSLLFLQPLFWISGQVQAQDYVPICIDQVFDLSTGEFGPPDPSLCGKGKRMGEGLEGDDGPGSGYRNQTPFGIKFDRDFKFENGARDSRGKKSHQDNAQDTESGWSVGPFSPIEQPLSDWADERTEKAQNWIDQIKQIVKHNHEVADKQFSETVRYDIGSTVGEPVFKRLEDFLSSKDIFNEPVLEQIQAHIKEYTKSNDIFSQVQKEVNKHFGNFISPDKKTVYNKLIINDIGKVIVEQISSFALEQLTKNKIREMGQLFLNVGSSRDWIQRVDQVINNVELDLKKPLYEKQPISKFIVYGEEDGIEKARQAVENILYQTAYALATEHVFEPLRQELEQDSTTLNQAVSDSVKLTKYTHFPAVLSATTPAVLYQKEVSDVVNSYIQARYDRKDLEVLSNKGLSEPEEEPYEFKSPEGEFLQKNQELYEKLKTANPSHEQGIRAREMGLSAVEVADIEYAEGHEQRASLAYSIGEGMSDIALGVLPYVGVAKDVYEAITGYHLLTGRALTGLERSFSVLGIALSTISGGLFNSTSMRLALNKTDNVLNKINSKLWDRYLKGLSDSEVARLFRGYPKDLFKAIEALGFKTTKGVNSALYFVKRAFANSFVRMERVTNTLKSVDRSGVEKYTQTLDDLKKAGVGLPKIGEEFLAKQLRFQREILGVGQTLTKADLMRMGRVYSAYYKNIDQVSPKSFKGSVWRGVKKSVQGPGGVVYKNNPRVVFDLPSKARYTSRRYSLPEETAIYTSLSRRTAILEISSSGRKKQPLTNKQIERLFHIGSKEIEVDKVLDLTDIKIRSIFKVNGKPLTKRNIATEVTKNKTEYELPQIIGHIAKRKGFKDIKAPSAPDKFGQNVVIFEEFK